MRIFLTSSIRYSATNTMPKLVWGQALSRSYGRFFAEFLEEHSLVRLGLLDRTTCVGLRYGLHMFNLRSFSWKALHENLSFPKKRNFTDSEARH